MAKRDINIYSTDFPVELVDQEIENEIGRFRQTRFFVEFDRVSEAKRLGSRIASGDLAVGTHICRAKALAWCARLLVPTTEVEDARWFLSEAKTIHNSDETKIAEAFLAAKDGDKPKALKILAEIGTTSSRSAALLVVNQIDGPQSALDWLHQSGLSLSSIDSEGKFLVLSWQVDLSLWPEAKETAALIEEADFSASPILHHMVAMACLLSAVPTEFREVVRSQIPIEAATFPLFSDAPSMESRKLAAFHFQEAAKFARDAKCPRATSSNEEYALWLRLLDPATCAGGRRELEQALHNPKTALGLVPLGLKFGVRIDLGNVEQEIEQQSALYGEITRDAAVARLALAFTQQSPQDVALYIDKHYGQLSKVIERQALVTLQIEMFSRGGNPKRAHELLEALVNEGLSETQETRLKRVISEAEGIDPVEARREQFRQSNSLGDLAVLVDALEAAGSWEELCDFGQQLFDRTLSIQSAQLLTSALERTSKTERLLTFLETNSDLVTQSMGLQMSYAWVLFSEGHFVRSRSELAKLCDLSDQQNYRALFVNLAVFTGDWVALQGFVAAEFQRRKHRSAHELIGVAHLATHIGSPRAKDLTIAAAEKGNEDAEVLSSAYFLATSAGWEGDSRVGPWLQQAANLSGENGPIQSMSLKEMIEKKPDWDRRAENTWQHLGRGEVPIFLACKVLNKSLVELTFFPAYANLRESDPRRRALISAYSGARQSLSLSPEGISAALDVTALMSLCFMGLLEDALDAFKIIHIPHSTLAWLFDEKRRAVFQQPSRLKDAHKVRDLLANDALERLTPSTSADSDLSAQVGDGLAQLIAEAEHERAGSTTQQVVVRPSPVHRLSTLMEEEADLSPHYTVISSCLAIVEKLHHMGQITTDVEARARAYLQIHEKQWPQQPSIEDGATLFLDELALTYLLHVGVIEKLKLAGFRVVAAPSEVSETNALIRYERIAGEVLDAIEKIRSLISSGIESGKIGVGRQHRVDDVDEEEIRLHPTVGVISLAPNCDAVISDDRFFNQHAFIDENDAHTPIYTSLDVVDALVSAGRITDQRRSECLTLIRQAGYCMVPVSADELQRYMESSKIAEGKLIENAELRAIRENIQRVRMSEWLRLPDEAHWLDSTIKAYIKALRSLWRDGGDLSSATIRSDWFVDQLDIRGWAHQLPKDVARDMISLGRGQFVRHIFLPLPNVSTAVRDAFWEWAESRILEPIREQSPELFEWLVDRQRAQIVELTESKFPNVETNDE